MKVLVLVLNSLPAGYLGCYGNDWVETPALDALAAEAVVFDRHYSDRPEPAAARRTYRTGRYDFPAAEPTAETTGTDMMASLAAEGIPTCLIAPGEVGEFAAGWGKVVSVKAKKKSEELQQTLDAVADAVERVAEEDRWLIWAEVPTVRPPWKIPGDFRERYLDDDAEEPLTEPSTGFLPPDDDVTLLRLQRTCAGAVSFLDHGLGLLLDQLREDGHLDDLLLVVTSDTGQALGEHGVVGPHRPWLHEELVHLPLIVRPPGEGLGVARVAALTQPVDLRPTLQEAFGLAGPPDHGHSLWPLLRGETEAIRPYACSGAEANGAVEWALRTPDRAYLLPVRSVPGDPPRAARLYVKPDDRWEVNDLVQHHLEGAERLETTLRDFVAAACRPGPFAPPPLPEEVTSAAAEKEGLP
jgi:arylsulfatase A-like enzyme